MTCALFLQLMADPYLEVRDMKLAVDLMNRNMQPGKVFAMKIPKCPEVLDTLKKYRNLRVIQTNEHIVITKLTNYDEWIDLE